jgi:outer membrane protein assembly factor BamA
MKHKLVLFVLILCIGFIGSAQDLKISEVRKERNKRTKTNVLKRLAFVKERSALYSLRIASDVRRFRLLPSVASASFKLEKFENKSYSVIYTTGENFATIPGLNVTQDVNDGIAYRTSIFDFNFLGQNQIIGGFYGKNVFDSHGFSGKPQTFLLVNGE